MKKLWPFMLAIIVAMAYALYSKNSPEKHSYQSKATWKTFQKKSNKEITAHKTTSKELEAARIPETKREIAQEKEQSESKKALTSAHLYRENRVLIGEIHQQDYQDEDIQVEMINKPNNDWKDLVGNDLIRFQNEETKVMIKEELPVIRIQNGKGQYLEQVIITYIFKNGNFSSYRALVDSETGIVLETWDKTIHEKVKIKNSGLIIPTENESGIIVR